MKAPGFWGQDNLAARALAPFGRITAAATARRLRGAASDTGIPVICVGNAGVGGAGKTTVVLDLLSRLPNRPAALSRGYGGRLRGPLLVETEVHGARDVGDEALLLAAVAPTIVARDRAAGARLALAEGAGIIVMDDGLQNPSVLKTLSLLVIDGGYGFGNGRLLPAGPLREPVAAAAARCQAAVLIGPDEAGALRALPRGMPVLRASLAPDCAQGLGRRAVLAFAGIGRPEKFFRTVRALGADLVATRAFGDHHTYSESDTNRLLDTAASLGATLVTTRKDYMRLPAPLRAVSLVVEVRLAWEDERALTTLLSCRP